MLINLCVYNIYIYICMCVLINIFMCLYNKHTYIYMYITVYIFKAINSILQQVLPEFRSGVSECPPGGDSYVTPLSDLRGLQHPRGRAVFLIRPGGIIYDMLYIIYYIILYYILYAIFYIIYSILYVIYYIILYFLTFCRFCRPVSFLSMSPGRRRQSIKPAPFPSSCVVSNNITSYTYI